MPAIRGACQRIDHKLQLGIADRKLTRIEIEIPGLFCLVVDVVVVIPAPNDIVVLLPGMVKAIHLLVTGQRLIVHVVVADDAVVVRDAPNIGHVPTHEGEIVRPGRKRFEKVTATVGFVDAGVLIQIAQNGRGHIGAADPVCICVEEKCRFIPPGGLHCCVDRRDPLHQMLQPVIGQLRGLLVIFHSIAHQKNTAVFQLLGSDACSQAEGKQCSARPAVIDFSIKYMGGSLKILTVNHSGNPLYPDMKGKSGNLNPIRIPQDNGCLDRTRTLSKDWIQHHGNLISVNGAGRCAVVQPVVISGDPIGKFIAQAR